MADTIHCDTHSDSQATYVCSHLLGDTAGLGFNRADPTDDNPFPDALCDDCELIHAAHGSQWTDEVQALVKISLLCSGCYDRVRIRNSHTDVTLDDLKDMRWKCGSCDEWHAGPILDIGFDSPHYWSTEKNEASFLSADYCVIEDRDFFVRGVIHLPIVGSADMFRWGVWGSLSRANFEKLCEMDGDPRQVELPSMFSWLSSRIPGYPDTLSLKMQARTIQSGQRPTFELDHCDHPLAQEFHHGIMPERVKEITMERFGGNK